MSPEAGRIIWNIAWEYNKHLVQSLIRALSTLDRFDA